MIKSINIKDVATYSSTGIEIKDLKKVNFFYGANGCGKTTISNYLQDLESPKYQACSIVWENAIPEHLLVYNKTFREKNLGENIKGIFTLGEATKEEIENIAKKQTSLSELKEAVATKNETLGKLNHDRNKLETDFKEQIWIKAYKKHESVFKEAFRGTMQKETFKNKIIDEFNNNTSSLYSYDDLNEKAKIILNEPPQALAEIPNINFDKLIKIEESALWIKKILGKSDVGIAQYIQRLNINDWVNEGRQYIQDNGICPFCQKDTITTDFIHQLESFFDESFLQETSIIKDNYNEYIRLYDVLLNELSTIESTEKTRKNSPMNIDLFSAHLKTLYSQYTTNKELMSNKLREPSRSISLTSTKEELLAIYEIISTANFEIKKHNHIVNNYTQERNALINSIWKLLTEENKEEIQGFVRVNEGLKKGIAALNKDVTELKERHRRLSHEIQELNKNITSVQPSVDEINKILKTFGFNNFSIVPSPSQKNHYQIQRENGKLVESTLSEGEITFITFLYYLQLAKGGISQEEVTSSRVLVIDDPISSLDSNILFVVSSLLKEIRKEINSNKGNIKQMIILTHNVYFHKEVSFIDGRTQERGDANFWILRKNNNQTSLQAFGIKNPIQNSYELLWKELKNRDLNSSITIQNTMRRIIENYFKILGKYGDDDLISKFESKEEQEICRSLLCWINDGSHCIPDDVFIEEQGDVIDKYFSVFTKIFKFTNHQEHYNMMMQEDNVK
ncbi:AAA family ATPase [Butyricimonas paravirosa]|uniref:AAA family ATPase n=1 Tax=Butyricimonas paravirosa TaxID=1472417 RepID=UPI002A7F7603|nr:AAA family ATPase [Butyricimonas paravirosa]